MTSFLHRLALKVASLAARCPSCSTRHDVDPSYSVPVHCTCGKTLTPKRIGLSLVLVERASA